MQKIKYSSKISRNSYFYLVIELYIFRINLMNNDNDMKYNMDNYQGLVKDTHM